MKAQEVRKMTDEELRVEHERLRKHVYELRSQAVTEKLENPWLVREARRDIARILTETKHRQMNSETS